MSIIIQFLKLLGFIHVPQFAYINTSDLKTQHRSTCTAKAKHAAIVINFNVNWF